MYKCEYCGKEFLKERAYAGHKGICKVKLGIEVFNQRITKAHNGVKYRGGNNKKYICKKCGKIIYGTQRFINHVGFCGKDKNQGYNFTKNGVAWNKGLTRYSDLRVAKKFFKITKS